MQTVEFSVSTIPRCHWHGQVGKQFNFPEKHFGAELIGEGRFFLERSDAKSNCIEGAFRQLCSTMTLSILCGICMPMLVPVI